MDALIIIKALGNLFLAAILFLAVMMTSAFSVLTYMFRGFKTPMNQLRPLKFKRR